MIDWAAARLDYVTHHELTYADIAAKYHAAPGSVWNHAARERWTEQRKTASEQLLEKARQKAVYSQSEQLAACNARHLELAEKLEQAVKQRLERADKLSENGLACPRWWSRLRASPVWLWARPRKTLTAIHTRPSRAGRGT